MTVKGWGNIAQDAQAKFIDIEQLSSDNTALTIGNCSSDGDMCISTNHQYINSSLSQNILKFDEEKAVIEVQAGITLNAILQHILPYDMVLMVTPSTGTATVGGCIACDVHGKNHETVGSFAASVLQFTLKKPNGDIVTCTPRKNKDLFYATIGGLGLTGAILTAKLQLKEVDNSVISVTRTRHNDLECLMRAMTRFKSAPYMSAWIDMTQTGAYIGRGILEIAHYAPEGVLIHDTPNEYSVPFTWPSWLINPTTVKLFNAWFFKRKNSNCHHFESYETFQYPLDIIKNWNKLYGTKGFYQFQCVIPFESAEKIIKNIIKIINHAGLTSPLSTLKRLGDESGGFLSFPTAGYSLSFDIPAKKNTMATLKILENLVVEADGRIYAAKDSVMSKETFEKMYPQKDKFLTVLKKIGAKAISKAAERYGLDKF